MKPSWEDTLAYEAQLEWARSLTLWQFLRLKMRGEL